MSRLRFSLGLLTAGFAVMAASLVPFTSAQASAAVPVSGRVVDAQGKALSGITVRASYLVSEPDGGAYFKQVGQATTDGHGTYRMTISTAYDFVAVCVPGEAVPTTTADARVVGRCWQGADSSGDYDPYPARDRLREPQRDSVPVRLDDEEQPKDVIDFTLRARSRVQGTVLDSAGQPASGVRVEVRRGDFTGCGPYCWEPTMDVDTTDENGRYDVVLTDAVNSPDNYCLRVSGAPLRHGTFDDQTGTFSCTRSIRIGQVAQEAVTQLTGGQVTKVNTPYWVGTAKVGHTVSARPGTWSPASPTLEYAWFDGTRKLATGPTYKIRAAELGHRITLRTTASSVGLTPAVVDFTRTEKTVKGDIYTAHVPTVVGTAKSGHTLTAKAATPVPASSTSYRWNRDGKPISGATSSKYTVGTTDRGKRLSVSITYKATGYNDLTRSSVPTAKVT